MRSLRPSPTSRSIRPVAAAALVSALLLTACGGTDEGDDAAPDTTDTTTPASTTSTTAAATTTAPTSTAATTTTTATTTTATSTPPTTEPPPTTDPTVPTEPGGSDDCLVGEWVVSEAEMNAFYDAVEARIDQPIDFTIAGQAGITFTGTTYTWTPAYALELELSGITGTGDAGGSISGTYTASDGILATQVAESAMTLDIEVAGQTIDGAALGNGFITSVPFAASPYSCDGPTPVIQFETIDDRHPVTLTPAG